MRCQSSATAFALIGAATPGPADFRARAAEEPRAQRLLRRTARAHELVVRCLRVRRHASPGPKSSTSTRWASPWCTPGATRQTITKPLDWGAVHRAFRVHGHDPGGERPGFAAAEELAVARGGAEGRRRASTGCSPSRCSRPPWPRACASRTLADPKVAAPVWKRIVDDRRQVLPAGQVHDVRRLRMDVDAEFQEPAPQHLLPGLEEGAGGAVHRRRLDAIPRDLWRWMDGQRAAGNELLGDLAQREPVQRHHVSDGGRPQGPADRPGVGGSAAAQRAADRDEAGQGPVGDARRASRRTTSSRTTRCSSGTSWARTGGAPHEHGSYVRQAYRDGIAMEQARGYNPYKFGVVSGSDSHVTVVPYRQANFLGVHGTVDDTIQKRVDGATVLGLNSLWVTPAGLSAVWAEENTREAIFAAMKRKETYSTSGVRIKVRISAAGSSAPTLLKQKDWVRTAYAKGVPMGADLPPPKAKAPIVRRLGGEGPRQPPTSTASRSSRAGAGTASRSRRSTTSPGPARASPIRRPARCRRSATRWTSMTGSYTNTHRRGGVEDGVDGSRNSIRASTPSTTRGCWRSRRRAGARSRR